MGYVLPWIIGNIECHQGKVIKPFLPHVLPGVDYPRVVFEITFLVRWYRDPYAGVLVG